MKWGSFGSGDGQFDAPFGVAADGSNNVYVVDKENHRVEKFGSDPTPIKGTTSGHIKNLYR